eukprot:5051966-Lingulodinium_polyedra.AAC.1
MHDLRHAAVRGRARLGGLFLLTFLKVAAVCSGSSTCDRQSGVRVTRGARCSTGTRGGPSMP